MLAMNDRIIFMHIVWLQCKDWTHLGAIEKHIPQTPPTKITRLTFPLPTLSCLLSFPSPFKSQEDLSLSLSFFLSIYLSLSFSIFLSLFLSLSLSLNHRNLWLRYGQYGFETSFERWPLGHSDHSPDYARQGKRNYRYQLIITIVDSIQFVKPSLKRKLLSKVFE